jgi:hypothetical protein
MILTIIERTLDSYLNALRLIFIDVDVLCVVSFYTVENNYQTSNKPTGDLHRTRRYAVMQTVVRDLETFGFYLNRMYRDISYMPANDGEYFTIGIKIILRLI